MYNNFTVHTLKDVKRNTEIAYSCILLIIVIGLGFVTQPIIDLDKLIKITIN